MIPAKDHLAQLSAVEKRELLKRLLAERAARERSVDRFVPDPSNRYEPFPLTEMQQAYLIGRSTGVAYGGVACQAYFEIESIGGASRLDAMEAAWNRLLAHHEMLRAIVLPSGQQRILAEVPRYRFQRIDLTSAAEEDARGSIAATRDEMTGERRLTDQWPLFDIRASFQPGGRILVHLLLDLMLTDASGLLRIILDWGRLCETPDMRLEPIGLSFRDLVLWQEKQQRSPMYARALEFWRGRKDEIAPPPDLPVRPASQVRPTYARRSVIISRACWERIERRAQQEGLTPSAVLCTAYAEAVGTWCRSRRFTLNLTRFDRPDVHPDAQRVIGESTSTVLLTVDLRGRSFVERARALQQRLAADLEHVAVSGVSVARELNRGRTADDLLFFPVVFTSVLGQTRGSCARAMVEKTLGTLVFANSSTPQTWIDHQIYEDGGELHANWDILQDLLPAGVEDAMVRTWERLVTSLAHDPEAWSSPHARHVPPQDLALRDRANATSQPFTPGPIHGAFADHAGRHPERPAIMTTDRVISHGELLRRALVVAERVRALAAGPGDLVAIHASKGWEQIAAAIGVSISGAAYVPIDAALPDARVLHLAKGARVCLTQSGAPVPPGWPAAIPRVAVADLGDSPANDTPFAPPQPTDLAYVIFTSGSTGEPKGVMIEHGAAVNTLVDLNERFGVGPSDRGLAISSLGFDLSVYDVFGLLGAGGALVLPDADRLQDPSHWAEICERHGVTILNAVPAIVEMLVDHAIATAKGSAARLPGRLRLVWMSGDWIPVQLPDRVRALEPGVRVISMGGATEASIWSIVHEIDKVDPSWPSIPYGFPLRNQQWHVLDEAMEPCPVWVPGSLYIAGVGVARGYLDDNERTRARFIQGPAGERMYATGDLGRYLPNGEIEFLGREDTQVKVLGNRIELGEIETALGKHARVASSVVVARGERGRTQLVAYVVPRQPDRTADEAPDAVWDSVCAAARAARPTTGDIDLAVRFSPMLAEMNTQAFPICGAALGRLGVFPNGDAVSVDDMMARGRILPRFRPWLLRVLEGLAASGVVLEHHGRWTATSALSSGDVALPRAATGDERMDRALAVLDRARGRLADVLSGKSEAVELLFEGGASDQAEHLYEDWFSSANATVRDAVRAFVAAKAGAPLRVVEIGAGVGSTTAHALPELPKDRTDYLYTDISPAFFEFAKRRFRDYPFLRFARFDIETAPGRQGIEPHGFDLVIASSVLHATRSIADTLRHVRDLLAPHGLLLMVEETVFHPSFNLTMGLQQGFDRFEDAPLRTLHPLLGDTAWTDAIKNAGFADVAVFSSPLSASDALGIRVLAARGPSDVGITADALRQDLAERLPAGAIPGTFVFLDALPLTANGKVDRAHLPDPLTVQRAGTESIAPRDERETTIADIWQDVLSVPRVGVHENFFDLGGDSLLLVRTRNRLVAAFGREIPLVDLFAHSTVAALAAHLGAATDTTSTLRDEAEQRTAAQAAARDRRRRARESPQLSEL